MIKSQRVLSGSITKGSTALPTSAEDNLDAFDVFRQGINIRDLNDLTSGLQRKIRVNSGIRRTLKSRDTVESVFNDTYAPLILSGSSVEISSPTLAGKSQYRVVHERERRDLGQSSLYDDGSLFEELANPDNALHVINVLDRGRLLPLSLVDHSNLSAMDGVLDPFNLRRNIDRSTIEHPFTALGIKGSHQQVEDPFLRSSEISDRLATPGDDFVSTNHYLDAPENFGNVLIPSVFNVHVEKILPFKEVSSDVEFYMNNRKGIDKIVGSAAMITQQVDLANVLSSGSFSVDDRKGSFDKMTIGGIEYETGPDSIAFGGLLK